MIVSSSTHPVSNARKMQELAALKESWIAEEHERAANNRRKKEEWATKRTEEDSDQVGGGSIRRKAESERLEELGRVEEERKPFNKHSRRS